MILDAGCGESGSLDFQLKAGSSVVAVDIDKRLLSIARTKCVAQDYVAASIISLPFKWRVFDVVFSQDVLEHIRDNAKALPEIARVTKVGGKFVGSTTNLVNPEMLLDTVFQHLLKGIALRYFGENRLERHVRFSGPQLRALLNVYFCDNEFFYSSHPPFSPSKFLNKKTLPWFVNLWILFDRLTSNRLLRGFKEMMVFEATR
jgi:SAM-dependent methyltransferase